MADTAKATREMTFLLAEPERRFLRAVAAKVPGWLNSNHFTGLGVLGAVGCGVGYALSSHRPSWLWLACGMLVVNWFGDSLDGTLARVRKAERPRYGYYIDHIVDAFAIAAVGVGIGLSPYVRLDIALFMVLAYLTLSINVYLESAVFGVFKIAYARIGPTEARIILILATVVLWLSSTLLPGTFREVRFTANAIVGLMAVVMFGSLILRFARNLHKLSKEEPRKRWRDRHRRAQEEAARDREES
ncbi:MAG: CDP-alcohol phosphatidyltransferase family protein [Gemmatimonadales bacterium]|jgi:phosphatidylglycerophosphate synthase|nr:CDP-alcohol phosphatidyltransferase family protein [Gemmatimonadales bacterium]